MIGPQEIDITNKTKTQIINPSLGLDYKTNSILKKYLSNRSFFASSNAANPITTTQRQFGMPASSFTNFNTFASVLVTLSVASTSALDTAAGTGARTMTIEGLDENYAELPLETITLNGTTPVNSTVQYFRINRLTIITAGSTRANQGDIFIGDSADTFTGGIPDTRVYCAILAFESVSQYGTFSVPEGKKLHFIRGNYYIGATATKPVVLCERFICGGIIYGVGDLTLSTSLSVSFDGAAGYLPKTDHFWEIFVQTQTVTGVVYYEYSLETLSKNPT